MTRDDELEIVRAQAYQVIGVLLDMCDLFENEEGTRALDYFSGDTVDEEFLPWPRSVLSIDYEKRRSALKMNDNRGKDRG